MPQQNWLLLMFEIGNPGPLMASIKDIGRHCWSRQLKLCLSCLIFDRPKQVLEKGNSKEPKLARNLCPERIRQNWKYLGPPPIEWPHASF